MTTYELTEDQMKELKQRYLMEKYEEAGLILECEVTPSYDELLWAETGIPDEVIHMCYEGTDFVNDDFSCTANL